MAKSLQIKAFLFGLCVATWNLGSAVSASNVRHLLQSYDDTIGADSWRINSGLEAECDGTGYPTSNWGGQTRLRHFRSNGFIIVQIRITISVLVRGYFGEHFTADSTFTFRFSDDAYNSYAANNWLWTPAQASTLIKLSRQQSFLGQGNFLIVATSVTVNIREWNIRIFEVVNIIANTCPSSGGCSGNGCGQNACGSSDCGTADAAAFAGASAGSSPRVSSGSDDSSGGSNNYG